VIQHGAQSWNWMDTRRFLPDSLWSLKWHVLLLSHDCIRPSALKRYSDWEMCVLFLVGFPTS
jgi:hypothetical protein